MKKILIICAVIFAGLSAHSQEYSWRLTYDVAIPLGGMKDYISQESWRGMSFDSRWNLQPNFSVGFNLGWQTFAEKKPNELFTTESGNISAFGTQYRFINTWPMQVNAHYYLGDDSRFNPWIGLSAGTAYSETRTELGFLAYVEESWSFTVTPQLGVDFPLSPTTFLTVGAKYNYFTQSELDFDYSFITFNAGFRFNYF